MEITQDKAMELAKLRRLQVTRQQEVHQQQAAFRQQQEYAERVQGFSRAATALFGQLAASDPAYRVKEAKIAEALRNPAFVQNMIAKFQPEQWLDQLRFMYDAIPATVATPTRRATPISSRPSRQSCGYFFACAYHACRFYLFFGRGRDTTYNTRKGKS